MPELPAILIAGQPAWADPLREALAGRYRVIDMPPLGQYMKTLIETPAALVVVDGDQEPWAGYVTTPKVSAATRRIPIILISQSQEIRADATSKGADLSLTPEELLKGPARLLGDYARVIDPAQQEQLDCECQEALPPRAHEGVKRFNDGAYYEQHDLFEAQWVETEGPVRDLYRAVLQVGVAYYQIERGNYRGALKMLQRSVQWLLLLPDVCQGIDVKRLRDESFRVRAELERLGEARFDQFDRGLIGGVHLVE